MSNFNLDTIFRFDEKIMEILCIPQIEIIDEHEELWKYVNLDRHKKLNKCKKYMISTYGRVYNVNDRHMMPKYTSTMFKSSKGSYETVKIYFPETGYVSYLVHRLVALAFIPIDKERPFVNHKDGIPYHNYLWNLEWCNASENYQHAVKSGLKVEQRGEERSNALWTDKEIHMICAMMAEGHKATYIYKALGDILKDPKVEYERVRTLYKHIIRRTHWVHISSNYDIDFTRFNYAKEQMSVNNCKKRKKSK